MFILVLLEDIVRIPPEEFSSEADAIHFQVNQKYANKVRLGAQGKAFLISVTNPRLFLASYIPCLNTGHRECWSMYRGL